MLMCPCCGKSALTLVRRLFSRTLRHSAMATREWVAVCMLCHGVANDAEQANPLRPPLMLTELRREYARQRRRTRALIQAQKRLDARWTASGADERR